MSDLQNYRELKSVMRQASFNVKGEAIVKMAHLFKWFDSLESLFTPPPPKVEPIEKKVRDGDR